MATAAFAFETDMNRYEAGPSEDVRLSESGKWSVPVRLSVLMAGAALSWIMTVRIVDIALGM